MNAENARLEQARHKKSPWKKWGRYISERQWGTVREDYSEGGDAALFFPENETNTQRSFGVPHRTP
jgi:hypothetical protein